jgi:hypothetical protein
LSRQSFNRPMFCPPGWFVPPDVFSRGHFVPPEVFSHGRFVAQCLVAGRFVAGRFVCAPPQKLTGNTSKLYWRCLLLLWSRCFAIPAKSCTQTL